MARVSPPLAHFSPRMALLVEQIRERFGRRLLELEPSEAVGLEAAYGWLRSHSVGFLYVHKYGHASGPSLSRLADERTVADSAKHAAAVQSGASTPALRLLVHAAFDARMPHGDVHARVSACVPGGAPVVPLIVRPRLSEGDDLRSTLGIPAGATVFGRHGGESGFDIVAAQEAVLHVAATHPSTIYFLLVNTAPFHSSHPNSPRNIIHLPACANGIALSRFIRTCDAMLHAKADGETFGLSVADFCAHERPVVASRIHTDGGLARFHLDVLGDKGMCVSCRADALLRWRRAPRLCSRLTRPAPRRPGAPQVLRRLRQPRQVAHDLRPGRGSAAAWRVGRVLARLRAARRHAHVRKGLLGRPSQRISSWRCSAGGSSGGGASCDGISLGGECPPDAVEQWRRRQQQHQRRQQRQQPTSRRWARRSARPTACPDA